MKYALKEGLIVTINYAWLCKHVVPHISRKFRNDTKLCNIFGLALLYACMSDSPYIEVPEHIRVQVKKVYNGLTIEETVPVMKLPLLVHRLVDQLQISEITGNDLLNVSGRAADGGRLAVSASAVTEALQALYIRSSCHEQQLNNLQLAHQASLSELKNITKIRVFNNNIRATWGTIAGGFALQNNGGQLRTLNDPAAHLLDEVIQPACLSKQPTSILQLLQEYNLASMGTSLLNNLQ
jgi:hypothetical protein